MRIAIIVLSFLPFLYYAAKDNHFHFHGRKVSLAEHVIHLAIGIALLLVFTQALVGNTSVMMSGLLFFLVAGALDEYVWHRDLPGAESDLHAKEHLALMIFVVVALVVNWLEVHQWQLPAELMDLLATSGTVSESEPSVVAEAKVEPWRAVLIPICIGPYAYFGLSDNYHHFRHRDVPWTERVLHLTIVLAAVIVVANSILGKASVVLMGLILFLIARSADEWWFHRGLPGSEVDRHAKTHFAFLAFILVVTSLDWFLAIEQQRL